MPAPPSSNALSLGRPVIDRNLETLDDVIQAFASLRPMLMGAGWPCGAKGDDTPYQSVYATESGGTWTLWGGKPSDPLNPDEITGLTGDSTLTVFYAKVNDATHVISTDGTLAFDTTSAIFGTAPASGTAENIFDRAFLDNETILVIGNGTPTYYAVKLMPNIQYITPTETVSYNDSEFDVQAQGEIINAPGTPSGVAQNLPSRNVVANAYAAQYSNLQQGFPAILQDNGKWAPLLLYSKALFETTGTISARSYSSPTYTWGSGTASMLKKTGDATHIDNAASPINVTLYNTTDNTIDSGRIVVGNYVDGQWFIIVDDC